MFNYSGGMGARADKDGLSATCYPAGISAVPIEVLEAEMPIMFLRKELLQDTGGRGRHRGGDGQVIKFKMRTDQPWMLNAIVSRTNFPPEGIGGGEPGAPGKFLVNGKPVQEAGKLVLNPEDVVIFETPGGGGYGASNDATKAE